MRTLNMLPAGRSATVEALHAPEDLLRRLTDIGLIPGTYIECLLLSPLGGLRAYLIRGALIALRDEDAGCIAII